MNYTERYPNIAPNTGVKRYGMDNGNCKLTDEQVAEIRAWTGTNKAKADELGVSAEAVRKIRKGLRR